MYLSRMELQGFKTFAQKTSLVFPGPKKGDHALTVVVGPNGSGKSNIADGIRWCLGEQSMKLLRGKSAQDVIFSGAEGRSRSGFAEVSLTFDNSDHSLNVSFAEVVVTRRLYRDGESEYLLNGSVVRLADIQLLLAEAGVGQRSYSVIGQGMIDHVLTASPEDRKIFFDDATGVRGFQIKRHQALLKLQKSAENLADVEMVLRELEPRLSMLRRQIKRLNERETLTMELATLSKTYYGTQWWNMIDEKVLIDVRLKMAIDLVASKKAELAMNDAKLSALEAQQSPSSESTESMNGLQTAYKKAQQELADARRAHFAAERELELAKVKAQTTWAPLPLAEIISEVHGVASVHDDLLGRLKKVQNIGELAPIIGDVEVVTTRSKKLRDRLTRPNPEDFTPSAEMLGAIESEKALVASREALVKESELAIDAKAKETIANTSEVFLVQREVRRVQQELSALEGQANQVNIDLARIETRIEGLKTEMQDSVPDSVESIMAAAPTERIFDLGPTHDRLLRLRHQLELIGGIDESVTKEYGEAEERFTFLSTQVADLRGAISSTEKVIDELDEQIKKQSDVAFKAIATEFQKYFEILFGGGRCSLVKLTKEEVDADLGHPREGGDPDSAAELVHHDDVDTLESIAKRVQERKDSIVGIDIQATPPGKRLKALNLLSGGERALTSIALVSAIMATNPAPFVVLDEVDAALDEANTVRFANILNELRKLTQFIVITHNRATMEKADMLYGVTMGDDGVSKLLSVKLEDYAGEGTARR